MTTIQQARAAFERDPVIRQEWRGFLHSRAWPAVRDLVKAVVEAEIAAMPIGANPVTVDQTFFRHQGALRALSLMESAADKPKELPELPDPWSHYAEEKKPTS